MPEYISASVSDESHIWQSRGFADPPIKSSSQIWDREISYEDTSEPRLDRRSRPWWTWLTPRNRGRSSLALRRGWKPDTFGAPMLGAFVLASVAVVVVLEILSHQSARRDHGGGIAFAADVNSLSPRASFGWVDLDVKRLEPWLQLSGTNGAEGKDSLLLQYPFEFLPFVPVTAFRRKHWGVFLAGTVMLMIFWVITPLQSSIFTTGPVTRVTNTSMATTAAMTPMKLQSSALNLGFVNTAYGISWLGQKLPSFGTYSSVVLPFAPVARKPASLPSEQWTTTVNAFSTTLNCFPAEVNIGNLGYTFSNGKGCVVPNMSLLDTQNWSYMINYVGYFNDPEVDYALQSPNCSSQFANTFLALWASNSSRTGQGVYSNLTAIFCETQYMVKELSVTVNASDFAIVSTETTQSAPNGTVSDISQYLNTTTFEYILATGVNPSTQNVNLPEKGVIQQAPRLANYSITGPVSYMVGFAIALNTLSLEQLSAPSNLGHAFERAHQLLLTTAISSLSQPLNKSQIVGTSNGTIQDSPGAIVLVREMSIIVEVALLLVSTLTIALWIYTCRRPSHMPRDASSISDVVYTLQTGGVASINLETTEESSDTTFEQSLATRRFQLLEPASNYELQSMHGMSPIQAELFSKSIRTTSRPENEPTTRPVELRLWIGIPFIFVITISIIGLIFLYQKALYNGISLPSTNQVVLSILENYLPTLFATLLEPLWVVLTRISCFLGPFEELRRGNAKAAQTLEASYTTLPPPLVIWRAFLSRHFLLAAVSLVALSTNILAVGLSALLSVQPTSVVFSSGGFTTILPQFNSSKFVSADIASNNMYEDHFYVALANLTVNTSLIPWTDRQYSYIPFNPQKSPSALASISPAVLNSYRASTVGFGANVTCVTLASGAEVNGFYFSVSADGMQSYLSTSHSLPNGSTVTCVGGDGTNGKDLTGTEITTGAPAGFPLGDVGLEIMQTMKPAQMLSDGGFCSNLVVAGWARASSKVLTTAQNASSYPNFSTTLTQSSFLACTVGLVAAESEIGVDSGGHVLTSNVTSGMRTDNSSMFRNGLHEADIITAAHGLIVPFMAGLAKWHNGSFASDWMNSLMTLVTSQDLVNPDAPAPIPTVMAPIVKGMYEVLFATLLGLNMHVLTPAPTPKDVDVQALATVARLFVSPIMFRLCVSLLSIHLVMAIVYYINRPKKFLPRLPTSIAAIMSYMASSRAMQDCLDSDTKTVREEQRYAFGRFIGTDKKTHIGIEQQKNIVPLKSHNPESRRLLGLNARKRGSKEPKTWI